MKKIFTIALAAIAFASCDNGTTYTISGKDAAFEDGKMVYISKFDNRKMETVDSVVVAKNSFKFKGEAPETPYMAYITVGSVVPREAAAVVSVYVEAGKITVNVIDAEKKDFSATGTLLNDANTAYNTKLDELYERIGAGLTKVDRSSLVRVELVGEYKEGLWKSTESIEKRFGTGFFHFEVLDSSRLELDYEKLKYDKTLKGEFIRLVINDDTIPSDMKEKIISCGLYSLLGEAAYEE